MAEIQGYLWSSKSFKSKQLLTWLECRDFFFFFGEAVGLGKTVSSIAAFCWLKERNPQAKMVVITTKSTVEQWRDEIYRFSTLRPRILMDTFNNLKSSPARYAQMINFFENQDHDVLICKYDSLKGTRKIIDIEGNRVKEREKLSEEIRTFSQIFKQHRSSIVLVLDEAHKFSSQFSQVHKLVESIAKYPERVWALTATAIKNNLLEFYTIAHAIGIRPIR